ncbi:MAG: TIGR00730 family Rossman fold protein [Phycisphaerales bacterium]
MPSSSVKRVCVYCGSSEKCALNYLEAARELGDAFARAGMTVVYGGGRAGLMGRIADGALAAGGTVLGILPRFMDDVEWGHTGVQELRLVDDMHERLRAMKQEADAFVALPGGCGTLDELFQTITWKRLGLHVGPIVIVNIDGFFDPCLDMLQRCIDAKFMSPGHREMWTVVSSAAEVVPALLAAPGWVPRGIEFAKP